MMGLRDCVLKGYYPGHSDILTEFFLPALRSSVQYDRITGDFSSSVLTLLAPGLREFIERDGRIRLMMGLELFAADVEAIMRGQTGEVIRECISWDALLEGQRKEVLGALAWLIDEGYLAVKMGAVTDNEGNIRTQEYGQWHQKIALFTDMNGDVVSVSGSPNESFKALRRNRESISVNRSWGEGSERDQEKIKGQREEFEQLWADRAPNAAVMTLPEALKADLISHRPAGEPNWEEVRKIVLGRVDDGPTLPEPYEYQQRAVDRILEGDGRLLVKHATGTGKTWTSLFALREILQPGDVAVLLTPTTDLVKQWDSQDNLRQFFPNARIIRCFGEERWRKNLYNAAMEAKDEIVIAISTMHPQTMGDVFDLVRDGVPPQHRALVADEVHNMGSPGRFSSLEQFDAGKARIGLSATLERDDDGDDRLRSYFGSEIDEITLEEAINHYEVLSRYTYHLHPVVMTPAERDEYEELTNTISHLYMKYRSSEDQPLMEVAEYHGDLKVAVFDRADVIKECQSKTERSTELLPEAGDRTMVFCNSKDHARSVRAALTTNGTRTIELFHGDYSGSKREQFLSSFEEGFIDTLVSIDCLTEGVDVPECDSALMITNSTSERESIQRRGRVLRKASGDALAQIHDFVVLPATLESIESGEATLTAAEVRMINRELDRAKRMSEAAENSATIGVKIISLRTAARQHRDHANNQH